MSAGGVALRTEGLSKRFGAFDAVSNVSLSFAQGARHALIGPNGAGKTTLINLLTGVFPATAGNVWLGDREITHLPQHARVKQGMTRTFQINTLFPGLTVLESVVLAIAERQGRAGVWYRTGRYISSRDSILIPAIGSDSSGPLCKRWSSIAVSSCDRI